MASYSGAASQHQTLTANTVDTVTLSADFNQVEVLNRASTGEIYFTVDGTTPTVGGAGTKVALAGNGLVIAVTGAANTAVNLISSGALAYSVTGC